MVPGLSQLTASWRIPTKYGLCEEASFRAWKTNAGTAARGSEASRRSDPFRYVAVLYSRCRWRPVIGAKGLSRRVFL